MIGRKLAFAFSMLCVSAHLATMRPLFSQAQDPYSSLVAEAKADLNSGNASRALGEAQKAYRLDPKPWQALLIAGAAQESLKQYHEAANDFADALLNAPQDKKPAIQDLFEKCKKEESDASKTRATALSDSADTTSSSGPTLEETIKFIQDRTNEQEGLDQFLPGQAPCTFTIKNTLGGDNYSSFISGSFKDIQSVSVSGGILTMKTEVPRMHEHTELSKKFVKSIGKSNAATYITDLDMSKEMFLFDSKEVADRVAKAIAHAAELCGGGSKPEPF